MRIVENYNLKRLNTFGIKANSRYLIEVHNLEEVSEAVNFAKIHHLPLLILGGGSNLLFTKDFDGLTIRIKISGFEIVKEDDQHVWVRIGAGEEWHQVVLKSVEAGYGGIENLSLIPGTVGAAPMQNIGAYGVELKEVFHSLEAYDIETGEVRVFSLDECDFGYRVSVFKNIYKGKFIITSVTLRLLKNPVVNVTYNALKEAIGTHKLEEINIKLISDAVIAIRQSKLPNPEEIGNAGSFFKNPTISEELYLQLKNKFPEIPGYPDQKGNVKIPAAWLIEQCGWKGKRINDAGVHEKHALILVNYGNATGREILNIAGGIQQSVLETFGIHLEPEVNII